MWCQENDLSLNVNKTKEMIVDFRKQQREHPLSTAVEKVKRFKFLCIHITNKLKRSTMPLQPQEAEEMWLVA